MTARRWGTADSPEPSGDESVTLVFAIRVNGESRVMGGVSVPLEEYEKDRSAAVSRMANQIVGLAERSWKEQENDKGNVEGS